MKNLLVLASSAAALSSGVLAQCPQGAVAGIVKWSAPAGYATGFTADDEGITSPPIALASPFPMAGAIGTLNQLWVNSNGEVYLTDSASGLLQPVSGATYGADTVAEVRGVLGASARVVFCGDDHQGSIASGAQWTVAVDTSVANEVRISWVDLRRYANATGDRFSFTGRLFLTGHPNAGGMEVSFGTLPADVRCVGISIGNNVAPAAVSSDLSTGPNSGVNGLLFEAFTAATWDLNLQTLTILPNGTGGYVALPLVPYVPPPCAFTASYGTGCYSIPGDNSVYELFADSPTTKLALDGNSMTYLRTPNGYIAVWNGAGGPAFVAPGGGATTLTFANEDDGNTSFTPSAPIPVPGGTVATWNCSVNGILTANASANNDTDWTPTGADLTNVAVAPNLGFYTWHDFLLDDTVPNGSITTEEVGGTLYVSWNVVEGWESGLTGTVNPSTWQYQVNMITGDVTVVWLDYDPSTATEDTLVGATLIDAGATPGAVTLATGLPVTLFSYAPLTLTASGRPVITGGGTGPSQVVTLTARNIPDAVPPFGISLGFLLWSVLPIPGGVDLGPLGIDVGMPGCSAYIATIDVLLPFPGATIGTQVVFNSAIPQPLFPGLNFYAQALALFPPNSLPGGLNNFGGLMSNGVQFHFENQ